MSKAGNGGARARDEGGSSMSYYGNLAGLAAAFSWLANYADTAWLARLGITSVEDAAMLLLRVYWSLTRTGATTVQCSHLYLSL